MIADQDHSTEIGVFVLKKNNTFKPPDSRSRSTIVNLRARCRAHAVGPLLFLIKIKINHTLRQGFGRSDRRELLKIQQMLLNRQRFRLSHSATTSHGSTE